MKRSLILILIFFITFSGTLLNKVYICRSGSAYAYHSGYCSGLNRCTHRVDQVTVEEAQNLGYKKACGICYK